MGEMRRVYLDNAATTMQKPPCVVEAVTAALTSFGNSGRDTGGHALDASRVIYDARCLISDLFNLGNPKQVVFTCNSTEALNMAIRGLFHRGDHVISSVMEHNAVLRPLYDIEEDQGVSHTFIGVDEKGRLLVSEIEKNIRPETKALILTHASNVTGNANDLHTIGKIAKKHGLLFIVDASQTAGVLPIDMQDMNIDIVAFTGHKGLYGPQGTGGMAIREGIDIHPLKSGGTGVLSYLKHQPEEMPTHLECGTMNAHGLAGLHASLNWLVKEVGIDQVHAHEIALAKRFYEGLKDMEAIRFYGDYDTDQRAAIVSLNIADYDSSEVSDQLESDYGISTRPGAHCAPLIHEAMGTVNQGMVRFAFSWFNTEEDVDYAIKAVRELATDI